MVAIYVGLLITFVATIAVIGCEDARRVSLSPISQPIGGERAGEEVGGAAPEQSGEVVSGETTGGEVTGGDMIGGGDEDPPPLIPGPATWARLTSAQYLNMVSDILGVDASDLDLEPDTNPYLFTSIGAERAYSPRSALSDTLRRVSRWRSAISSALIV